MATYEEAYEAALEYYNGDDLPAKTFVDKYALRKGEEFLETTPTQMDERLAKELYRIERGYPNPRSYEEIIEALSGCRYFYPQGSVMFGAGNPYTTVSLSNCFVINSPEDTISSIVEQGKDMANIMKRRGGVGVDISKLRPEDAPVNNAARTSTGAWSFADFYSYICRMIGQCLHPDTLISTYRGLIPIKKVEPGDLVWTKSGWVDVVAVPRNGKKKLYKLTDEFGFEIVASGDHIFTGEKNGDTFEKPLKDFNVGDSVVLVPGSPERGGDYVELSNFEYVRKVAGGNSSKLNTSVKMPEVLDEKLAYVLGYSYGDGYVEWDKFGEPVAMSLSCSNDWTEIKENLHNCIKSVFKIDAGIYPGGGDLEEIRFGSKLILGHLRHNGLLKQKAGSLTFPEKIFISRPSVQLSFIAGYLDADGYASGPKKGYVISSVDKDFLNSVRLTLLSNGIFSKLHKEDRSKEGWKDLYTLCVVGASSQERFINLCPSYKVSTCGHVSKRDNILTPFKCKTLGIKTNEYNYAPDNSQYISTNCFDRLVKDGAVPPDFNPLIRSTVKSVEFVGEEETYDLSLSREHLFFAQGFQVHNSGRRGALMITIDVRHPDVFKFVKMKKDLSKVTGANVSIKINDGFMEAVKNDTKFTLQWPVESSNPKIKQEIQARDLWEVIIDAVHASAEPGLLMWDTMLKMLPAQCYADVGFEHCSTNPCGEIILAPGGACRLLAMNLTGFVENSFTSKAQFNFTLFSDKARLAQRMMDNIVDLELEAVKGIIKATKDPSEKSLWKMIYKRGEEGRRTGLGTFGLADTLAKLQLRYDSDEALEVVGHIFKTLRDASYEESINMAEERGAFPAWDWEKEKNNLFLKALPRKLYKRISECGRRNISNLTNAPTGSLAIFAGNVSSGIEPVFRTVYTRRKKVNHSESNARVDFIDESGDKWQEFNVFHKNVADWIKDKNPDWDGQSVPELPEFFVSSDEIDWEKRVKLQGVIQQNIDHSISSTINLPESVSVDTVSSLYLKAWEEGLKGVTIYREGSRSGVLITNTGDNDGRPKQIARTQAPKRPAVVPCDIYHGRVQGEPWTIIVGLLQGQPYELFGGPNKDTDIPRSAKEGYMEKVSIGKHKNRYDLVYTHYNEPVRVEDVGNVFENKTYGTFTRTLSLAMRHGAPIEHLVEQLGKDESEELNSLSSVLRRALKRYIKDGTTVIDKKGCEKCGSNNLRYSDGCPVCLDCAFTKCK